MNCIGLSVLSQNENKIVPGSITGSEKSVLPAPNIKELTIFNKLFDKKFQLSGISVSTSFYLNRSLVSNDLFTTNNLFQYNIQTDFGIDLMGIPFKAEYVRRESQPEFLNTAPKNWYKFSMDVERYKEKWKELANQLGPEVLTKSGAQLKTLKDGLKEKLISSFKEKAKDKAANIFDSISNDINPLDMAGKTPEELAHSLFGQDINNLLENAKRKAEEISAANIRPEEKDSLIREWNKKIEALEEKARYVKQLYDVVSKAESSGVLKEMKALSSQSKNEYENLLKNPEELTKKLADKFNIGGLGKFFTLLSQFKAGGQLLPFADNISVPFLGKGISFEINIGDKFIGFSTGSVIPVINDLRFTTPDSVTSDKGKPFYWFLHYRKGKLNSNHKGIKLTGISEKGQSDNQLQPSSFRKRNTILVNLYSKERLFNDNWLGIEVTKSMATGTGSDLKDNLFNLNNVSFKITDEGKIENAGIVYQLFYNKLKGAYYNLTDNYFSSKGFETGVSFKMNPKKKKITSYAKANLRNFNTPGAANGKWKSFDFRARFGYKLKKGQSIQLSGLWHDGYKRYVFNSIQRIINQQSRGLTADFNLVNKRLLGLYNTSYISLGWQKDIFPMTTTGGITDFTSNSYTALLNQSFLLGEDMLQLNVLYTKVSQDNNVFLYNTRLDADGGGIFKLNENMSIGASLVFGYFKDAYTNMGIRSSVSAKVFKKFLIDISSDIRKNMRLQNPLFDQFINISCDVKYTIK